MIKICPRCKKEKGFRGDMCSRCSCYLRQRELLRSPHKEIGIRVQDLLGTNLHK